TAEAERPPVTDFDRLFAPRGVAVVGASTKRPNFGNMFLTFYKAAGYAGRLVAVHPSAEEIDGVPCVPSLAEADVDYALVAVPAKQCADVVRQASGVPFVQVMSGGFGEMGEPGLEADLAAAAREAGVRLLGPNCMGVYSPAGGQTFLGGAPGRPGRIAVVSQSGGLAGEVVKVGERRGLAFSKVATVGNSLDVTPAELLRHLSADEGTSAIGLYLEDPRDGRGLFDALRSAGRPVVALVGGRSDQGRTAAASHTGGMIGDDRVWTALGVQTGTALVRSQDDLIGALDALDLHGHRTVRGDGVLVIGPSGGASVLAADVFDGASLDLPGFPDAVVEELRGLGLGAGSSLANPLEIPVGPRGNPDLVRGAVAAILARRAFADVV
ncbi:CoA-binding protein, partial [Spirillospora sp. NPDC049652]